MTEGLTKKELEEQKKKLDTEIIELDKKEKESSQVMHTAIANKQEFKLKSVIAKNKRVHLEKLIVDCHTITNVSERK